MKLTLEQLESEDHDDAGPFELDLGDGLVINLPHPMDIPFNDLIGFDPNNAAVILRTLMGADAFEKFAAHPKITARRLEQIMHKYDEHYGLGLLGEGDASPKPSNGAARRSKPTSGSQRRGKAS